MPLNKETKPKNVEEHDIDGDTNRSVNLKNSPHESGKNNWMNMGQVEELGLS